MNCAVKDINQLDGATLKLSEVTLYLDNNHNTASEKDATWKVIHKYDENDILLEETWVEIKKEG